MKYALFQSAAYKRARKRAAKRGLDLSLLDAVVTILQTGASLPAEYKDHALKGDRLGQRECHVDGRKGDWLLVYEKIEQALVLYLVETGTHDEIFGR